MSRDHIAVDEVREIMLRALVEADVAPALIHAFKLTGRVLTKETYDALPLIEQIEWDDAIASYEP